VSYFLSSGIGIFAVPKPDADGMEIVVGQWRRVTGNEVAACTSTFSEKNIKPTLGLLAQCAVISFEIVAIKAASTSYEAFDVGRECRDDEGFVEGLAIVSFQERLGLGTVGQPLQGSNPVNVHFL